MRPSVKALRFSGEVSSDHQPEGSKDCANRRVILRHLSEDAPTALSLKLAQELFVEDARVDLEPADTDLSEL
jgi:hypothetical protein